MRAKLLLMLCLLLSAAMPTAAQDETHLYQVFVQRDTGLIGEDTLTFVDLLTGSETIFSVDGERYTPFSEGVLFYQRAENRVKLALPNGGLFDHPFVQPDVNTRRVDWVFAPDSRQIAWTLTGGTSSALITVTQVANLDGSDRREILVDGPRDGIRALPVSFHPQGSALVMDYQPDVIGELTPFRQYAGLFMVDLTTGQTTPLPDEPGCFCGAAVSANEFVRLALTDDVSGYNVRAFDLLTQQDITIPALSLAGFTQAGDVLISPDGTRAVYALAQVSQFGTPAQTIRTVFVGVHLPSESQVALTEPITTYVKPVAWTDENSAILFTSPTQDGTWKVSLADGNLARVASATYIGLVRDGG